MGEIDNTAFRMLYIPVCWLIYPYKETNDGATTVEVWRGHCPLEVC